MKKLDPKYGIPQLKKFPMPDARHVRSAIKFFNYVTPKYEKQLAAAIIRRMKEYGLSFDDFTVGDENRFSKYVPKRTTTMNNDYLAHYGILGMHWGIRRFQPYPKGYSGDGKFTGKDGVQIARVPTKEQDLKRRIKKENKDYPGYKNYNEWKMGQLVDVLDKADYYKTPEKLANGKKKADQYFDKVIDDLYKGSLKKPGSEKVTDKIIDKIESAIKSKLDQRQKDSIIKLYAEWKDLEDQLQKPYEEWMNSMYKDPKIKKIIDTWDGDGTELYYELQDLRPNKAYDDLSNKEFEAMTNYEEGCKAIGKDTLPRKYGANTAVKYLDRFGDVEERSMYSIAFNAADSIAMDYEQRAKQMAKRGKTYEQIADSLGISESSVGRLINLSD